MAFINLLIIFIVYIFPFCSPLAVHFKAINKWQEAAKLLLFLYKNSLNMLNLVGSNVCV